ncbi:MAG: hypothetical protein LBK73_04440 [Treponema sp.]|nr:hypothetical protein [Treponema sp.]
MMLDIGTEPNASGWLPCRRSGGRVKYEDRVDSADGIKPEIRRRFDEFPGVAISFSQGGGMMTADFQQISNGFPVAIVVRRSDLVKEKRTANPECSMNHPR